MGMSNEAKMSWWLGETLRRAREDAGAPLQSVVAAAGLGSDRTLYRLETHRAGYGRDIDAYIAAYGFVLGISDARDLWQDALDTWRAEGRAPDLSAVPGAAFVRQLGRDLRPAQARAHSAHARKRPASGSRPEAG